MRDFARALEKADVAVFFYAGHGLQASGRNYLVPVDARLQVERDLDFEAVSVDFVLKQMELEREGKTNVVFLDACRDNPLARNLARSMGTRSAAIGQGLAQVQTGVGTFIAYSTQPGNVALDGQGRNSPFTAALTKGLQGARPQPHLRHDRRAQGRAGGDGRQAGALGPFGPHRRLLFPAGRRAGHAAQARRRCRLQRRLRELEEELKKKSDPQQTANMVALAQARERLRTSEEANKQDQKKIFDIQYNSSRNPAPGAGAETAMQIGGIQMQMARRGQEMKTLREQIAKLEADLGLAQPAAGAPSK